MDTPTNAAFIALKHVEADSTIIIYITLTVQIALELSTTLIIILNYILLPAMPKIVITRYLGCVCACACVCVCVCVCVCAHE